MCGIAGIIHFSGTGVDPSEIVTMLNQIRHRGPDDEGVFTSGPVGLGHVRLSILDLSPAGHQPMWCNNGRYCIVFNGEIYNYRELKKELNRNYDFKSLTDTEVLLASYLEWGEECLHKLNGDFAFVIYDSQEKTFFGARDRFGIKPFYYRHNQDRLMFASEIKALLPFDGKPTPNNKIIFEYLAYNRTDQSEETFFNSIHKLKHGHCFTLAGNLLKIRRWYSLSDQLHYPTTMNPGEFREELKKSVELRLRSDVPVGVCLSGGIDSSSITSIVYEDFKQHDIQTFSAVFDKNEKVDESRYIRSYQPLLRHMHFIRPSADTFYQEFRFFIETQTEPTPGISPYAQYKVMQAAHGNVSVTLDGQGADEMLGGYNYFYGSYFKELFTSGRILSLLSEAEAYFRKNESREAFAYFAYYLLPPAAKSYFGIWNGSVARDFYHAHYKESNLSKQLHSPRSLHSFFLQHFEYKLEHLLKWDDLNSMRFSIESRVPFLDHHLVEKTLSLPSAMVMKKGVSKYILRESVRDILPAAIYNRTDKIGFDTPADEWLRTPPFREYILALLHSTSFSQRGYFNPKACLRNYQLHLSRKANLSKEIWKWINLEHWSSQFIDKEYRQTVSETPALLIPG
jgi:asparagine synthase (glutamine-hydrolysing)